MRRGERGEAGLDFGFQLYRDCHRTTRSIKSSERRGAFALNRAGFSLYAPRPGSSREPS